MHGVDPRAALRAATLGLLLLPASLPIVLAADAPSRALSPQLASVPGPQAWTFANIRVTQTGPYAVTLEWVGLPGADAYRVNRNGSQFGPLYQPGPAIMTVYDNTLPPNSQVSYSVTALHMGTIPGLPGTPGAGANRGELPLQTSNTAVISTPPVSTVPPLVGFVDLHTHPASYLGFGGKLIYGAVDVGADLPPGSCNPSVARNEYDALSLEYVWYGPSVPNNPCGDSLRATIIPLLEQKLNAQVYDSATYGISGRRSALMANPPQAPQDFSTWPAWNDVFRQKMWVEWIRRAYQGGLRVMVALAVNNKLLADMTAGPNTATDDKTATTVQIEEIKAFVGRHTDFMQIATSAAELHAAVAQNKLAVVLGVEIDNIGDLVGVPPVQVIDQEVDNLFNEGVRYIFPVHLVDNPIGRTAVYVDLFNVANVYEEGAAWQLGCESGISYQYQSPDPALAAASALKVGGKAPGIPPSTPCAGSVVGNVNIGNRLAPEGLSAAGKLAVQHMMDLGMLIDVDHMSELSVNDTLSIAEHRGPVAYPLFSGHNNLRGALGMSTTMTERALTGAQYARLGRLHGMAGIGSAQSDSGRWLQLYQQTVTAMGVPLTGASAPSAPMRMAWSS